MMLQQGSRMRGRMHVAKAAMPIIVAWQTASAANPAAAVSVGNGGH